jgi:cytochrome c oxidase subunit 1
MTITADRTEVDATGNDAPPDTGGGPKSSARPGWLSQHVGTALVCAIIGYAIGHWFGNYISSDYIYIANSGSNAVADTLALALGAVGWLAGIGALNYPAAKMIGREAKSSETVDHWSKYVRFSTDHKVVGLQYIVGVLLFLFTGGLLAMAIRTELLSPTTHVFGPGTYIEIVSEHGTIMMMMASSLVVGPLGNYFVPLMIGARHTAFPRIEAFSFWLFMAGYGVIVSALPYGGFPTGWTGYAPLQTQAGVGMISYLLGFAIIGAGMMAAGFNLLVTIIHYRAPGMTWSRLPIFVWSILATAALLTLATPVLFAAGMLACSTGPRRRPSTSRSTAVAPICGRTSSGSSAIPRCT